MNKVLLVVALAGTAVLAAFVGYRYGAQHTAVAPASVTAVERKPLYWHDPMFPQQKFDKPGKSPFMDMQLVPVYADPGGDAAPGVSVSATAAQNLGVRTVQAELGTLEPKMEAAGAVAWNERNVVLVQLRAAGFVEKLHARAQFDPVAKGAPLVELLIPEWAGAQEEFLLLQRAGERELAAAARQRLLLLGMGEAEIARVEQAGAVQNRFTLRAPIAGVIAELGVREGMTVPAGATLFRLVDLATVWVNADIPEAQATSLRPGAAVEARVPSYPDEVFKGRVGAILPELNAATRTVRARIELSNPGTRLKPGMFATLFLSAGQARESVLVPSEAVIRTGERDVVVVADGSRFLPVEVQVGRELGGRSEILQGLKAGARVVASGQFLIDSEASLKGTLSRLEGESSLHSGSGRVVQVDPIKGLVELAHGPMPTLKWPAMQMEFVVADAVMLTNIKPGDAVEFELRAEPDDDGDYVIERIRKQGAP